MDDASLEDFFDEGDSTDDDAGESETEVPATYQWTPSGATCMACGDRTERRWHGDDGLVCPDCKEW